MNNKIIGGLIAVIGCCFLAVIGSIVVMIAAPGTEIFGIRYIASGLSSCEYKDSIDDFSGDIYIDTYGVPITINFTEYFNYNIEFSQNYIGLTKSKHDKASISVTTDAKGDLHIKTKEIVKWLFSNESDLTYKFVLSLPAVNVAGKSIYINSNKSSVSINGGISLDELQIETSGALKVANTINVDKFKFHTSTMINVGDKINANSVDLKSTGSSITVQKPLNGDLKAQTKSGDIKFVSCKNLNFKTSNGSVKTFGTGINVVRENVSIETRGGDVLLGNIGTANNAATCEIKTISGDVNILSMNNGTISTERGKVYIENAKSLVVNDNIGDVEIKKVAESVTVNGRNGDVVLGSGGVVNNPTVSTTTGKIDVKKANGIVKLESSSNKITFENEASENITLKAGRALTATKLKGEVTAYANRNMSLKFSQITGNVNITVGSKCDRVDVDATCRLYTNVDYSLKSTKGKKVRVYADDILIKENTEIESGIHAGNKLISIKTSYAEVNLKLGKL